MKKYIFLLIIILSFVKNITFALQNKTSGELLAQNLSNDSQIIDSLLSLIKTDKVDTNKINNLNKLGNEYKKIGEYEDGLKYAKEALQIATVLAGETKQQTLKQAAQKGIAVSLNLIGIIYWNQGNYEDALKNHLQALKIREEIKDKKGMSFSYNNIGLVYDSQGNYSEALKNYLMALKLKEEIDDKPGISGAYNNIGAVYYNQGNYPEALKNYFASLKIDEELGDKQGIAIGYNNIGNIYANQGDFPVALKNFFASLKIREDINDKQGIANSYNNIGLVFSIQGNLSEALKNYLTSLKIGEEIGDQKNTAGAYNNIGLIYYDQKNYPEAIKNYLASLKIREEIGDKDGIATSFINLGAAQTKLRKPKKAADYLSKALQIGKSIGSKDVIKECYKSLAELDSIQSNWKESYKHYRLFIIYRDSIDNEESKRKTIQSAMTYEFEKKELATQAAQEKKDAIAAAESKKQKLIIVFAICGLILVLVFAGYILRSLKITRQQKNIIEQQKKEVDFANEELNQQNEEISAQRDEILMKNEILHHQNEEIQTQRDELEAQRNTVTIQKEQIEIIHQEVSQSIDYATRIQTAILSESFILDQYFAEHFVLYRPKDKVSGDFYWWAVIEKHVIITVADCTGHGVPGAFMSMLGTSFLREIVIKEYMTNPAIILKRLRKEIIHALKQKGSSGEQKDGMDMALIVINTETMECQFAGANNPCYVIARPLPVIASCHPELVEGEAKQSISNVTQLIASPAARNDEYKLIELKADKMPVAIFENMQAFTNKEISLKKGDCLYMMSDGYQDQFGGPKNKKFLSKNLKQLLTTNSQMPMASQKELLENTLDNWIGNNDQIDDITLMGIRI